ncbi:MAG: fimbrial assembly protein [Chloroflexaceae bacterium]|nr:fimbrial assembly protein [Chloroflexaceae bacterium]
MVVLPLVALLLLWQTNSNNREITTAIQAIDQEIATLQAEGQQVQQLQEQLKTVEAQTQALVSVFDQIKPWSAILGEISDRIPLGVVVSSLQQGGDQLTIAGIARTYAEANNFLLALQQSPFLEANATTLTSTKKSTALQLQRTNAAGEAVPVEVPEVVEFTIVTTLSDVPASQVIEQLSVQGATGLVTRIKTLEQKGAIKR